MSACRSAHPARRCSHYDSLELAERLSRAMPVAPPTAEELLGYALDRGLVAAIDLATGRLMVSVPGDAIPRAPVTYREVDQLAARAGVAR